MWAKYLAGNFGSHFLKTGPDGVQIWSRFGPDLVQILRYRPSGVLGHQANLKELLESKELAT